MLHVAVPHASSATRWHRFQDFAGFKRRHGAFEAHVWRCLGFDALIHRESSSAAPLNTRRTPGAGA